MVKKCGLHSVCAQRQKQLNKTQGWEKGCKNINAQLGQMNQEQEKIKCL